MIGQLSSLQILRFQKGINKITDVSFSEKKTLFEPMRHLDQWTPDPILLLIYRKVLKISEIVLHPDYNQVNIIVHQCQLHFQ